MDKIMVYPKKDNNCRFGANGRHRHPLIQL